MTAVRKLARLLVAAVLFFVAVPAGAADPPPRNALFGVLNGNAEGMLALAAYFNGSATPPEVVQRARQIVEALRSRGSRDDPQTLVQALDRMTEAARAALNAAQVMSLVVDPSFVPQDAVAAFDFGPADTPAADGFERVAPGDARLGGTMDALRRPDERGMPADGIAGIRRIAFEVPGGDPGPYRILLATRELGEKQASNAFFGAELRVNGVPGVVRGQEPSEWVDLALLTNDGGTFVRSRAEDNGPFRIGEFDASQLAQFGSQGGGAVLIETYAVDGRIEIELPGPGPTYLTGMLAERSDRPSMLVLSPAARAMLLPLDQRLALEAEIQALVAQLLAEIAPAAGPNTPFFDLPPPVFLSDASATPV